MKGVSNRALFACKRGCFASSFLLLGIGLLLKPRVICTPNMDVCAQEPDMIMWILNHVDVNVVLEVVALDVAVDFLVCILIISLVFMSLSLVIHSIYFCCCCLSFIFWGFVSFFLLIVSSFLLLVLILLMRPRVSLSLFISISLRLMNSSVSMFDVFGMLLVASLVHVVSSSGRAQGDGTKVTERAQSADFCRKPLIFADSPLLLKIPAFGGRRKPADFRWKPQIFAENRRKPQILLGHLGPSPLARP